MLSTIVQLQSTGFVMQIKGLSEHAHDLCQIRSNHNFVCTIACQTNIAAAAMALQKAQ